MSVFSQGGRLGEDLQVVVVVGRGVTLAVNDGEVYGGGVCMFVCVSVCVWCWGTGVYK